MAVLITPTNLAGIIYIVLFIIAISVLYYTRLNDSWINNKLEETKITISTPKKKDTNTPTTKSS